MTYWNTPKGRINQYLLLTVFWFVVYGVLNQFVWTGTTSTHTLMEVAATVLAASAGAMILKYHGAITVRFLIGGGLIGTAILDGYHAIVTSSYIQPLLPSDLPSLIPWSWLASRTFLAIILFLSWFVYWRRKKLGEAGEVSRYSIIVATISFTILSCLFFIFVPLPRAYYPEFYFHRPEEFLPAFFFCATLLAIFKTQQWKNSTFDHYLVLALITNTVGQALVMSNSSLLFDVEFDLAHIIKKISYLILLTGAYHTKSDQNNYTLKQLKDDLQQSGKHEGDSIGLLSFTRKISLFSTSMIALSFLIAAIIIYKPFITALSQHEFDSLEAIADKSQIKIQEELNHALSDINYLSTTPPISGILRTQLHKERIDTTDQSTESQWQNRLEQLVVNLLYLRPQYLEVYFHTTHNGRALRFTATDGIQEQLINENKDRFAHIETALTDSDQNFFISSARLYSNQNSRERSDTAQIYVSKRIFNDSGKLSGVLTLNLDIGYLFNKINNSISEKYEFYVTNSNQEYIFHKNHEKAFLFEFGRSSKITNDYAGLTIEELLNDGSYEIKLATNNNDTKQAITYKVINFDDDNKTNDLLIFLATNYDNIIDSAAANATDVVITSLICLGFAILFAWLFATTLTSPIRYIALSIHNFGLSSQQMNLPTGSKDEVGVLARAFKSMMEQVQDRTELLKAEVVERKKSEAQIIESRKHAEKQSELMTKFARDIQIKNKELEHAREDAESASIAKSEFLATMSHEIRTPMNGVLGMAQMLENTELTAKQRSMVDTINNSGQMLVDIINDILDFSKIEAGKLELEPIAFDLEKAAYDVTAMLSIKAEQKAIDLIFYYQTGAPNFVIGDAGRIRQLLVNLIGNAIKFTDTGHIMVRISCEQQKEDMATFKFSVEDTGVGIDQEAQDRLFDAFTQADASTTRKFGGTGLGLSICRRLVELMNGTIGVESDPGKGSKFSFILDLPITKAPNPLPELNIDGMKVLIVDDNATNRQVLKEQLSSVKLDTHEAASGADALTMLELAHEHGAPFKLAILDFLMPKMDGYQLAKRISETSNLKDTKLVLLTSAAQKGDAKRFADVGVEGYLTKPTKSSVLYSVLKKVLAKTTGSGLITQHSISEEIDFQNVSNETFHGKVLLVEDTLVNQEVATMMLNECGVEVMIANDGYEALEAYKSSEFDLVFMDCLMPRMDGYEATRQIRSYEETTNHHTTIIALTASALKETIGKCENAGMDDFMSKPYTADGLKRMLVKWLPEKNLGGSDTKAKPTGETANTHQDNSTKQSINQSSNNTVAEDKTQTQSTNDPVLDSTRLEGIVKTLGERFKLLVTSFINETDDLFSQLDHARQEGDHETMERLVHSIKSGSGNLGGQQLWTYAQTVEDDFRANNLQNADQQIEILNSLYQEFLHALEIYLENQA